MAWLPDLSRRHLEPEIMDDPALDPARHFAALSALSRLNRLSLSARIVWGPIRDLAARRAGQPLHVLDIASGAGDIPMQLARRARRQGLNLRITALDKSDRALDYARRQAKTIGEAIDFRQADVHEAKFQQAFDVVMCSLFLHHLDDQQGLSLLRAMAEATRHLVLVNDLCRGSTGWVLAYAAARIFTRSDVVRVDGPLSVQAALTIGEVKALAKQAGLSGAQVTPRWPCRYLLHWESTH